MLGNYLQQTTSADDIFRCIFFLGALRLRAVPYGMEITFAALGDPPLNVTIFITNLCNCVMGATPMCVCFITLGT